MMIVVKEGAHMNGFYGRLLRNGRMRPQPCRNTRECHTAAVVAESRGSMSTVQQIQRVERHVAAP